MLRTLYSLHKLINYIGKHMSTFTALLDIRNEIGDKVAHTRLDNWAERLYLGRDYNRLTRAIEAYLSIDINTERDMPETLEQMKKYYSTGRGLAWCFNDAIKEYGIPISPIDETEDNCEGLDS